jgi:hypothetical protein
MLNIIQAGSRLVIADHPAPTRDLTGDHPSRQAVSLTRT